MSDSSQSYYYGNGISILHNQLIVLDLLSVFYYYHSSLFDLFFEYDTLISFCTI